MILVTEGDRLRIHPAQTTVRYRATFDVTRQIFRDPLAVGIALLQPHVPLAGAEFTALNDDLSDLLGVKPEGVFVRARLGHADLRRFASFLVLEEDGASQGTRR